MAYSVDEVDYGPLQALIGHWQGDKGLDVSPDPQGDEKAAYADTIVFSPVGDATNAEQQKLAALHYHQAVTRISDGKLFHNETGYWLWDPDKKLVMQTLTIPRGLSLVAGGPIEADATVIEVTATDEDSDWTISQSPFLQSHAKTRTFHHRIEINGDLLRYDETMLVDIYGKQFVHTDKNELQRI